VARHDEVGADETAAGCNEPADEGRRDGKWRFGDDPKRLAGESQVTGIRYGDDDRFAGEALPQLARPPLMELNGDDSRPGLDERRRERPDAGADVEHKLTGNDDGLLDEADRPSALVIPPPGGLSPGHGAP
jgi:hypothetical protein